MTTRPTRWWLDTLRRRADRMHEEYLDLSAPVALGGDEERRAAVKFFNAAFRAEESGLRQAHELADEVRVWDQDLAEVLELYGNEEGWHRQLLTQFLEHIDGEIQPMGRVTRTLYKLYGRARHMETIVLVNLMFETIGSTTYRLALRNVEDPVVRQMLTILTRDEAFHVPLNVHFLRHVLARAPRWRHVKLKAIHRLLFATLAALPLASRPKAQAFDRIPLGVLSRAYVTELARVFAEAPDLGLPAPALLLWLLGAEAPRARQDGSLAQTSAEAAELAADRTRVHVTAL